MRNPRIFAILLLVIIIWPSVMDAQRRRSRKKQKTESVWPPERAYSRVSLGYALQKVFQKHYDFCGFPAQSGKRDYTPPTIERFLGKRSLRTKVEQADLSGGNLLNYIFSAEETSFPLDVVEYRVDRLLDLDQVLVDFMPQPQAGFDAFIMTKNCSGYLKACLDAGINPPYSAFGTALSTDEQRQSSVLALAGSFVSPLAEILAARDSRTTELMARLWLFYQQYPAYIGNAYYLREFEGVMIRHLTDAETIFQTEQKLGVNVNLPFGAANFNSEIHRGREGELSFEGTDWETIIYADFAGPYQRGGLYAPLPNPDEIADYFAALRPTFSKNKDFPLLTEGAEHKHYLSVAGIPRELARLPWKMVDLRPGVYASIPRIDYRYYEEKSDRFGLQLTVSGQPATDLFAGAMEERLGSAPLQYSIVSEGSCGGQFLRLYIDEELATSLAPIVSVVRSEFDLTKRDNRQFACQWTVELEIKDDENPIAYEQEIFAANLIARNSDREIDVELVTSSYNTRNHTLLLTFATRDTWPLDEIDDRHMTDFNLSTDLHLPTSRGWERAIRPIKVIIAMPRVGPREVMLPKTIIPQQDSLLVPNLIDNGGRGD